MAASLLICTKEQQSYLVHFLWEKGAKSAKMHTLFCADYGNSAFSPTSVYRCLRKAGKLTNAQCSGCPILARGENLEGFRTIVLKDRIVTITEITQ
jgi:hypothetical protein